MIFTDLWVDNKPNLEEKIYFFLTDLTDLCIVIILCERYYVKIHSSNAKGRSGEVVWNFEHQIDSEIFFSI